MMVTYYKKIIYFYILHLNLYFIFLYILIMAYTYCIEINCNKRAYYNYENKIGYRYCINHKKENMVNKSSKKCKQCKIKQPYFNYKTEKSPIYCGDCKLPNMVNIKSQKCIKCNNKRATYNYKDEEIAKYCKDCKLYNMIDVRHNMCVKCNKKRAIFNYENNKTGLYCCDCKLDDMILVQIKKCKTYLCETQANKKYDNHCFRCFMNLNPNHPIIKKYKVKENHMIDYIKQHFNNYIISYDKQIKDGCSKKRPDCLIQLNDYNIIIECDENQHKYGEIYSCDTKRMMEIFNDLGNSPIVFIRFNPDSYKTFNGQRKKSCFKNHAQLHIQVINSKKEYEFRLNKLKETIEYYINNLPYKEVEEIKLFYDGYVL